MEKINLYLGCDPGKTGCFCALIDYANIPTEIVFFPNNALISNTHTWLIHLNDTYNVRKAMLEDVSSVPGASAKANFIFGKNVGTVDALLQIQSFGLDKVRAKVWQKEIGIKQIKPGVKTKRTPPQLKKEVANIAERLYPGCKIYGPRGGLLDGRSDALMIAHYCYLKYK